MTESTTRRGFLGALTAALGSIPILGGLFVVARAGLAPAHSDRPERLPLCRLDEVPEDDVLVRAVSYQMRRGPAVEDVSRVVLVTRDPDQEGGVIAMAGECTHLACPVQKRTLETGPLETGPLQTGEAAAGPLRCPCHGGVFSRTGEVLAGPPPRPLRRLRIELPEGGEGMIHLLET